MRRRSGYAIGYHETRFLRNWTDRPSSDFPVLDYLYLTLPACDGFFIQTILFHLRTNLNSKSMSSCCLYYITAVR